MSNLGYILILESGCHWLNMIFNFPALVAESTSPSGVEPNLEVLPTVRLEAKVVEAVPAVAVARGAEVVVAPSASPLLPAKTSTRSSTPTSRPVKMLRLSMKKRRKSTKTKRSRKPAIKLEDDAVILCFAFLSRTFFRKLLTILQSCRKCDFLSRFYLQANFV